MVPDNIHNTEIEKRFRTIDEEWLNLHYKITVGIVFFSLVTECLMSLVFAKNGLIHTTLGQYIIKYIVIPSGSNLFCILMETAIIRSKKFTIMQKIYVVSFSLVLVSSVLFTVHGMFTATYYIFPGAIMMTIIYANYRLTVITAASCLMSAAGSEILIQYDPDKVGIFENSIIMGNFLVSMVILFAFSMASIVVIRFEQKKNAASIRTDLERDQLKQSIQIDELTGIYNRKALQEVLKSMETNKPCDSYVLAVVDIDNFKNINDSWGHYLGDQCLTAFAKVLMERACNYTPYRYGGDEFCLVFRNVTIKEAADICEEIRQLVEKIKIKEGAAIQLTASFGLSSDTGEIDGARLFVLSDYALYDAKKVRNCVRIYQRGMSLAD